MYSALWLLSVVPVAFGALQQHFPTPLPASLPPSSFALTSVSRTIELGGALTRESTSYTLEKTSSGAGGDWIVGVSGQEGFIEASESTGGGKKEIPLARLGRTHE